MKEIDIVGIIFKEFTKSGLLNEDIFDEVSNDAYNCVEKQLRMSLSTPIQAKLLDEYELISVKKSDIAAKKIIRYTLEFLRAFNSGRLDSPRPTPRRIKFD